MVHSQRAIPPNFSLAIRPMWLTEAGSQTRIAHSVLILIALASALYWFAIAKFHGIVPVYGEAEVKLFLTARFGDVLGLMDFGQHKRFSPLVFGPLGFLDVHFFAPTPGESGDLNSIIQASRLIWLHAAFAGLVCLLAGEVAYRLTSSLWLAVLAAVLIGWNDSMGFEMRFASTLVCYGLRAAALLAIFFFVRLAETPTRLNAVGLWGAVLIGLLSWEQGLNLALAVIAALATLICARRLWQKKRTSPQVIGCLLLVLLTTLAYCLFRIPAALEEAMGTVHEATYFFSYPSHLLMADDLMLNLSQLLLQSWRQLMPFPPISFSVVMAVDMNDLNTYNLIYSKFPNMQYRLMGLFYGGIALAATVVLVWITAKNILRSCNSSLPIQLIALFIFILGTAVHLPIMNRDYFFIPGYVLGYKASISYVGFVFLLLPPASRGIDWLRRRPIIEQRFVLTSCVAYIVVASMIRTALTPWPPVFPW